MHTSRTMHTREFAVTVDGHDGGIEDVLPDLGAHDRLAIVTRSPGGAIAAAPLLLAAVGRYYELLHAERSDDFYRYPSFFVVHVGEIRGYHGWLDVWPEHREVVVAPHGEAVLEALHDRAITHVVLEAAPPAGGELMRENANWFLEEVRDVLAFDPAGHDGGLGIRPSDTAARMIVDAVRASAGVIPDPVATSLIERAAEPRFFRRLSPLEGLARICAYGPAPDVLGQSADYLGRHGADATTMSPHRFTVSPQ